MKKFTPGYKCRTKQCYLVNGEGDEDGLNQETSEDVEGEGHNPKVEIFVHALVGAIIHHTIRSS